MKMSFLSVEDFNKHINEVISISDTILDGWTMKNNDDKENGKYIVKKQTTTTTKGSDEVAITYEYHIAYNISYGVPIICFNVWKPGNWCLVVNQLNRLHLSPRFNSFLSPDGTFLSLEEYWECNKAFMDCNIYETLTQMDHPVLCKPFLTLHPCRTQEILQTFISSSKNPVISWLSVVGPFVNLNLLEEYTNHC